jgi:phage replication O-like protein O
VGYTRFDNDILEALYQRRLSTREIRAVLFILRESIGRGRSSWKVNIRALAVALEEYRGVAEGIVEALVTSSIVLVDGGGLAINQDTSEWRTSQPKTNTKPTADQQATNSGPTEDQQIIGNEPLKPSISAAIQSPKEKRKKKKEKTLSMSLDGMAESTPKSRKQSDYSEAFEAFWLAYPGGGSKKEAGAEWVAAGLEDDHGKRELVLNALASQVADRAKKPTGEFYAEWPDAQRWLKKERWTDKLKYGGPAAAPGAALPIPSEIRDRPWVAVWLEKRGRQPDPISVMNLASALGVDAYEAQALYHREGLAAAGDWVWQNRKTS